MRKISILFKTGFFHIFGSSVINKIISFLSSIILVHILTKSEYGVFTYAWNIYSLILLLNGFGIESAILQLCSEQSGNKSYEHKICNYGTRFGIKFNILLAILTIVVAAFFPLKLPGSDKILYLLSLLPMSQLLLGIILNILRSQKRNQDYAKLSTINTILILIGSTFGAVWLREKGMALGYYVAYTVSFLIGRLYMKVELLHQKENMINTKEKKTILSIAFISMCNNGLSQLLYLLDIFILGIVDPQETVLASYKVSTMIPTALTFIPLSLITYLYPYFAQHNKDGEWCLKKYKQVVMGLGMINLLIATFLLLFSPYIILIFFGKEYLDAVTIFRILAINYFFSGTFRVLSGNLLVTQRKLKFNLIIATISGLINIIADFLFIQWWGAIGAAYANTLVVIISGTVSTIYLIYTFKHLKTTNEN